MANRAAREVAAVNRYPVDLPGVRSQLYAGAVGLVIEAGAEEFPKSAVVEKSALVEG